MMSATVQRVVLYEGQASEPFQKGARLELLTALLDRGYSVSCVQTDDDFRGQGHQNLVVLGQFNGPIPTITPQDTKEANLHVRDIAGLDSDQVLGVVEDACQTTGGVGSEGWKPWFPVIDYDRCTNCMQCLSFCLFDVYGATEEGKITVRNETNCKTDCPACSRVCPEVAILFPKYKAGPINGDEVNTDDVRREAMKVDISSLLGGDIYSMLRDRNAKAKSRFSKERDDERALKERQRCLKKLQAGMGDLDIPAEALTNLPSADEIRLKAEQSKKIAQEALERQKKDL
ncbi:ATP-binding protein [Aeoliella mucimassa]|uniref:4Fe-4S binding domain protein n=1 Tax=Aeoliella mucimassa TaxID=2527972 RepID=A0A518AP77_9BACT|nr:ferredoxin family protein [Aeoliella mucimassa]QDU56525.1 4Fe-4S binding domain protein [Aeoliella mucimassa]